MILSIQKEAINPIAIVLAYTGLTLILILVIKELLKSNIKKGFSLLEIFTVTITIICITWMFLQNNLHNFDFYRKYEDAIHVSIISLLSLYILIKFINITNYTFINEKTIDQFRDKLINNENFLTAFNTSLPVNKEDKEYGLEYIPFILQNVENKRIRFKKYSEKFLAGIIFLTVLFTFIVISFGYILINDSAFSFQHTFEKIENQTDVINREVRAAKPDNIVEGLQLNENLSLQKLKKTLAADSSIEAQYLISEIDTFTQTQNLNRFIDKTNALKYGHKFDSSLYYDDFNNLFTSLNSFRTQYLANLKNLSESTVKLNRLLSEAEVEVSEPNNQLNETVKRLILSLVIVTFFIAILRYFIKLYSNNYNQMILAENEDLLVRKLYIALKNTDKNQEERKVVIQNLVNANSMNSSKVDSDIGLSETESNLIKGMLDNLLKKL